MHVMIGLLLDNPLSHSYHSEIRKEVTHMICIGCCKEETLVGFSDQLKKIVKTTPEPEIREIAKKLQELLGN